MEKPITVTMEEYQNELVAITNRTELPTFLKAQIAKDLLTALSELANKEREEARAKWLESQLTPEDNKESGDECD